MRGADVDMFLRQVIEIDFYGHSSSPQITSPYRVVLTVPGMSAFMSVSPGKPPHTRAFHLGSCRFSVAPMVTHRDLLRRGQVSSAAIAGPVREKEIADVVRSTVRDRHQMLDGDVVAERLTAEKAFCTIANEQGVDRPGIFAATLDRDRRERALARRDMLSRLLGLRSPCLAAALVTVDDADAVGGPKA